VITRKNSCCGTAPRFSVQGWLTHTHRHWEHQLLMAHNSLSTETAFSNFPHGQPVLSPHSCLPLNLLDVSSRNIPQQTFHSVCCCCSVAKSCLTLCDPMDCGTPDSPALHYLPEFTHSCPLSQRCYLIISSSVTSFSFCLQSFPASGSFPVSQLFTSDGQSIGASASVLLTQSLFPGNSSWYK